MSEKHLLDVTMADIELALRGLISLCDSPMREGLRETPKRFMAAFTEHVSGYRQSEESLMRMLKTFEDGSAGYDTWVIIDPIPFYSLCEHHLAPFFGEAYVGYIPKKNVVGLSKIPRLVEAYSRRLQVQERITVQIADALQKALEPVAVGVVLRARHMCVESRGVRSYGAGTTTSAMRGEAKNDEACRAEFMRLIGK